ncbi:MAG TPA: tetratricopeptide repeat protein [Vicinamibacterales bacterium]|nr:tetratricopeptide repeat protein [Vicinamibacterales bacterium]
MRGRVCSAFTLVFALLPVAASAQPDEFAGAVRLLATVPGQSEPQRSGLVRDANARMRTALATWDSQIREQEGRVANDLKTATGHAAAKLHAELGVAYRLRGRLDDALKEFDAAAALEPSAGDVQMWRGLTFTAAGRDEEAGRAFRAAWATGAHTLLIAYYVARGPGAAPGPERDAAIALLLESYRTRFLAGQDTGDPTSAFIVPDILPDNLFRMPVMADDEVTTKAFEALTARRFDEAIAALSSDGGRVLSGKPGGRVNVFASAHLARAQQFEAENRVTAARPEYEAAFAGTLFGRAWVAVGIARAAQVDGDLEAAVAAFTRGTRADPNNALVHEELATAYIADGRFDDAFCEAVAALLIDPRDGQPHAIVGQLRLDQGHDADAIAAFTRALELSPDRYETRYALAQALKRAGREADAARELERFDEARRAALEKRRRGIETQSQQEEAEHERRLDHGNAP